MANEDEFMALLSEYVAGELPAADALRVEAHVDGCESCQRMVQGLRLIGPALGAAAAGADAASVDHTFALARAGARAARDQGSSDWDMRQSVPRRMQVWQRALPAAAMAATVLLALGLNRLMTRSEADENVMQSPRFLEKGVPPASVAEAMELNLSFSVQSTDGTLARGKNGWQYPPEALLYFRCQLPREGYILLVRVGQDGVEPLMPGGAGLTSVQAPRGDWDLSDGTHLLGYSLDGLRGSQRFVALFGERPFRLTPSMKAMLVSGRAEAELIRQRELVLDELKVEVAPR